MQCTFYANSSDHGASAIHCWPWQDDPPIARTIIALGQGEVPITCEGIAPLLTCCDIFGNSGGDWVGCIADQYGVAGNISEDPRFCDPASGDFTLQDCSPCAPFSPPNEECDLIGAWVVGCGGTLVSTGTWGGIKILFKE